MTRLDRIEKLLKDYDNYIVDLLFDVRKPNRGEELDRLRAEAKYLVEKLEKHGCRRRN